MFKKIAPSNCISCVFKPLLRFSYLIGIPRFLIKCQHTKLCDSIELTDSKLYSCTTLAVCSILMIFGILFLKEFFHTLRDQKGIMNYANLFINFIFCMRSSLSLLIAYVQTNKLKTNLIGLQRLIKKWARNTSEMLMEESQTYIYRITHSCAIFMFIYITFFGIYFVIVSKGGWKLFKVVINLLSFYCDAMMLFEYTTFAGVYYLILKQLYKNLKIYLNKRQEIFCVEDIAKEYLVKYLIEIRRIYKGFLFNLKSYNQYCNPGFVLWLISENIALIVNIYAVGTCVFSGNMDYLKPGYIECEIQLVVSSIIMLSSLYILHMLGRVVSNFIFKFIKQLFFLLLIFYNIT